MARLAVNARSQRWFVGEHSTMRQSLGRFVHHCLSRSKYEKMHELALRPCIRQYEHYSII